jgi:hypothetical protein
MDNLGIKIGESLIFYFVAVDEEVHLILGMIMPMYKILTCYNHECL